MGNLWMNFRRWLAGIIDWPETKALLARLSKSWTVWFNAFIVPGLAALEMNFHLLYFVLGPTAYPIGLAVVTAINIILRAKTERAHMSQLPRTALVDDYNADLFPRY